MVTHISHRMVNLPFKDEQECKVCLKCECHDRYGMLERACGAPHPRRVVESVEVGEVSEPGKDDEE